MGRAEDHVERRHRGKALIGSNLPEQAPGRISPGVSIRIEGTLPRQKYEQWPNLDRVVATPA